MAGAVLAARVAEAAAVAVPAAETVAVVAKAKAWSLQL